jgi:hypothetical protein
LEASFPDNDASVRQMRKTFDVQNKIIAKIGITEETLH